MTAPLRLDVLGATRAQLGDHVLGADSRHPLAALLVLWLSPERRVTRRRLGSLLWPEASSGRQSERLRWLLCKLRRLGIPLHSTKTEVRLDLDAPDWTRTAPAQVDAVLPGYAPEISPAFTRWIEEQRDSISDALMASLAPKLDAARSAGDWSAIEEIARAMIRVAPLHEEATLALAETCCARGDRARGLALLDRYLQEIGEDKTELRIPAELMLRRIQRTSSRATGTGAVPFVGRSEELRRFTAALEEARDGRGSAAVVAGPAGIGKTRLIGEMLDLAAIAGAAVVRATCHAGDGARPLSIFSDLVPALLDVRGAAGCDPQTVSRLAALSDIDRQASQELPANPQELSGPTNWLAGALAELLTAITDEQVLVIALDDLHWADRASKPIWDVLVALASRRSIVWCFGMRAETPEAIDRLFSESTRLGVLTEWLGALTPAEARSLVEQLAHGGPAATAETIGALAERAGGIPLVVRTVVEKWQATGEIGAEPATLKALLTARLGLLTQTARRVVALSGLLGAYATLQRLERILQLPRNEFIDALARLEGGAILSTSTDGSTSGHALWAEIAISQLEPSVTRTLHAHIAAELESEMESSSSLQLLWEIARHWGASGQHDRELQAIERGAETLVKQRLFSAAADAYGLALAKEVRAHELLRLLRRRVTILRFAGRWLDVTSDIDRHEELASRLDPMYDRHNEMEMLRYSAYINTTEGRQRADEALRCALNPKATKSHRFHAAYNCVRLATAEGGQRLVAAQARAVTRQLLPETPADWRNKWKSELEFACQFEHVEHALQPARELYALESHEGDDYMLCWCERWYGAILCECGAPEEGFRILQSAIDRARSCGFDGQLAWAIEQTVTMRLRDGSWGEIRSLPSTPFLANNVYALLGQAATAVVDGRNGDALAVLEKRRPTSLHDAPDHTASWHGIRLRALLRAGGVDAVLDSAANQLRAALEETEVFHAHFAAAIYTDYLDERVGPAAGDAFLRHYLTAHSGPRMAIPAILRPYVARVDMHARA